MPVAGSQIALPLKSLVLVGLWHSTLLYLVICASGDAAAAIWSGLCFVANVWRRVLFSQVVSEPARRWSRGWRRSSGWTWARTGTRRRTAARTRPSATSTVSCVTSITTARAAPTSVGRGTTSSDTTRAPPRATASVPTAGRATTVPNVSNNSCVFYNTSHPHIPQLSLSWPIYHPTQIENSLLYTTVEGSSNPNLKWSTSSLSLTTWATIISSLVGSSNCYLWNINERK